MDSKEKVWPVREVSGKQEVLEEQVTVENVPVDQERLLESVRECRAGLKELKKQHRGVMERRKGRVKKEQGGDGPKEQLRLQEVQERLKEPMQEMQERLELGEQEAELVLELAAQLGRLEAGREQEDRQIAMVKVNVLDINILIL